MKPAKHDKLRGRHKKSASRETVKWNRELLIPERPPWMSAETYRALAEIREAS